MSVKLVGFERLKEECSTCPDFGLIYSNLISSPAPSNDGFYLHEDYLFRANQLCIPRTHLRDTCWRFI